MRLVTYIFCILASVPAFGGSPVIWEGSSVAQFLTPIIKVFLGNGYSLVPSQAFVGDCSDGNVTITTGTTSLSRDMFYNNLTISGTGQISFQNQRVFVCGTLDISNAAAFALDGTGPSGTNGANGGGAGSNGNTIAVGTNITGRSGGNGGAGGTTTGTEGAVGVGGNSITGQTGGSGGAGGAGSSGAGGIQRAQISVTAFPMRDITTWFVPQTGAGGQVFVGGSGAGGAGGGGDGAVSGGGGGGGGASGQTVYLAVNILKTSASTAGSVISAWGGNGGNGGSPTSGNAGGGGGGGSGSGGWIVFKYNQKIGAPVSGLILAIPGFTASLGGTGHGTGVNGSNGNAQAAQNGLIQVLNFSTGVITSTTTGTFTL